ncbi:MAG: SurA N-terminal domain-containing protein [Gammaproteobacteria bacterium]|nr:SurA N-terminal domain-containing protein [Gammaproteobacteria bacterium]
MMEKFRAIAQGPVAAVLLGLVLISFAVTGVDSYLRSGGGDFAAKINGESISQNDWERAIERERNRMGENYAKVVDTEEKVRQFRRSILERLIFERLGQQAAEGMGLRVGKDQVNEAIWAVPAFQVAGKFNPEQYQTVLRNNGLSNDMFQDSVRSDLLSQQITRAISETAFALPSEVVSIYKLDAQTRDVEYLGVPLAKFVAGEQMSEADAKAYYEQHPEQFREPERVKIEYLQLSVAELAGATEPIQAELEAFHKEKAANYTVTENRRVAHILVNAAEGASADEVKKAEAKIQAIQARLSKGEDFAAVAKSDSEDSVSAEQGGDLDWLEKGAMDPEFDKAAYGLKAKGDVSAIVKSAFGFHIIKLLDIKPGAVLAFDKVKDRVKVDFIKAKQDSMSADFFAKRKLLEEKAYEYSDSLAEAIKATGLKAQETALFTREAGVGVAAEAKVRAAAFAAEVLSEGRNSEIVELGEQNVMVLRVNEHKPAVRQELKLVLDSVKKLVAEERAKAKAKALADSLFVDLKAGKDLSERLKTEGLEWKKESLNRNGFTVDPKLSEAAFRLSREGDGKRSRLTLSNGDELVLNLVAVKDGDVAKLVDPGKKQLTDGFSRYRGEFDFRQYLAVLKSEGKLVYGSAASESTPQ